MDWVAIYAALVSTATGAWTVYEIWRDRPAIKVKVFFSPESLEPLGPRPLEELKSGRGLRSGPGLYVEAINHGRRPVTLSHGGLLSGGKQFAFDLTRNLEALPKRLGEGESFSVLMLLWQGEKGIRSVDETDPIVTTTEEEDEREVLDPTAIIHPVWAYWSTETGRVYKTRLSEKLVRELQAASQDARRRRE